MRDLSNFILFCLVIFSEKFGIYFIDFAGEAKTRVPKKSVEFFKDLLSTRTIPGTL
jgi:beta-glucosidase/6-phospho-beta-glucosidase/beta-galactosidase